jgi:hypothetical protein
VYHYTREAIASKAVDFRRLPGDLNPADTLSKQRGYEQVWPMLRTSNPDKSSKTEESPMIQSTVAKDTPTSEPDQESLTLTQKN